MIFENYPAKYNNMPTGTIIADIANHCNNWNYYRVNGDPSTSTHEGSHGVNSQIRNASGLSRVNGFYCLQDRSIVLSEPNCRKSDAVSYVPASLRFSRFNMYVVGQKDWESTPLYIFDEWLAYANGAACSIEIDKKGLIIKDDWPEEGIVNISKRSICCQHLFGGDGSDRIFGAVEFMAYCSAVLMSAPKPLDAKLIEFTRWHLERSVALYNVGRLLYPWSEMDKCFQTLQQAPETAPMRAFQKDILGFNIVDGSQKDETNYYV